ncbi:3'-5' exonuclease [Granulicella tundricola]|uniref:DNA 3'-5' helicase n=1 Tax=Granulicella tundricola (strain ATCC BAA-1859 / DSM 23138 / MP5ACTX9) TaxID=1198114 RepID=E8X4Y7_GRATM|nr:3'-5' exonuclease [Granulicella tundricola]ADW67179.1 UvrD/REP helicase [Granulicella tundricola MP5ACTX9]
MQFLIASTFQDSLGRLQPAEQNAAKLAAIELQMNPAHPGLQMHKLDRARDKSFWSARVSDDLRMILHRTDASCLLCYVDHHDSAYAWAERRKLTVHPKTGAAQMVVLQETVQHIIVPRYVPEEPKAKTKSLLLLAGASDADLLRFGVPEDWLDTVRNATEETVLDLVEELPEEAREAILSLATGVRPAPSPVAGALVADAGSSANAEAVAFTHPDAQRRFRIVSNLDELQAALDAPWEKWTVFLHPGQRAIVERNFNGPARVTGSAGTGKTIVALHRAVYLAQNNPSSRVLLTTFSEVLANALDNRLRVLISNRSWLGEQIEVLPFEAVARRLYASNLAPLYGPVTIASAESILTHVRAAMEAVPSCLFSERFLMSEWAQVVDAAQLRSWEAYRDYSRAGRRSRLREPQREVLWQVFDKVLKSMEDQREMTTAEMFVRLAKHYAHGAAPPFDFAVVDEAQDISMAELRCLGALGSGRSNALFFAGDTGQRIFQQLFSWKSAGVDVRGRSSNLKVNYRTSHQIRHAADRLLASEVTDGDGSVEERRGTVSVFNGPSPELVQLNDEISEARFASAWLVARREEGHQSDEMAIFVRSAAQLDRAEAAARATGMQFSHLVAHANVSPGLLTVCTMHLAKGLEFRDVVIMACEEDVLPDPERIGSAGDASELDDIYNSERQLLYVACTRSRDRLLITSAHASSEFIEDMRTMTTNSTHEQRKQWRIQSTTSAYLL